MNAPFSLREILQLLVLPALVFSVYGQLLLTGFLSDDFLFLGWASQGWGELLARVTAQSYPQVIRPLPALAWPVGLFTHGALWLRILSLGLHSLNAVLLSKIVRAQGASRENALLVAGLFAVFPLSTEAICWVSAQPDLLATSCALGVLWVATRRPSRGRIIAAITLYVAALLSKEIVVLLPLILVLIHWRKSARRLALVLSAVGFGYLGLRVVLFGGFGGYLDSSGQSLVRTFSGTRFLRAMLVQVPLRTLTAFRAPGSYWPYLAVVTAALLLLLATGYRWRALSSKGSVRGAIAIVLAVLPTAPVFRVEWDHEGSRFLYWPVAVLCVAVGALPVRRRRLWIVGAGLLGAWFLAATLWNTKAWVQASRQVENTLAAMALFQEEVSSGSTVIVDSRDTFLGAYVFRNGLAQAARLSGLRSDVHWERGTVSKLGPEMIARLGHDVFAIEPAFGGTPVDRTACTLSLLEGAGDSVGVLLSPRELEMAEQVRTWSGNAEFLVEGSDDVAIVLHSSSCVGVEPIRGSVYWKNKDRVHFTVSDSREFQLVSGSRTPVRLGAMAELAAVRIDLERSLSGKCWPMIELVRLPVTCSR